MSDTQDTSAADRGSALTEGLGLAPERAGQPRLMTVTPEQADNMHGHWYSPAAVREMLAAERERCERLRAELRRVQDYIDETPELFEALGPLDHGA